MISKCKEVFSAGTPAANSGSWIFAMKKGGGSTLLLLLTVTILGCGCHKKTAAPAPPPATAAGDATPAPGGLPASSPSSVYQQAAPTPQRLPSNPAMQVVPPNADINAVLNQLSMELRRYVAYTRMPPKTFKEFVANDPVSYPAPPAGKQYELSQGKVILR
jgi:hypothetical protein